MRISIALLFATLAFADSLPLPDAGNVSLPLEEYNKLIELAARPPKKPDAPPQPYAIKTAQVDLQVKGESISGTIALAGEVFAKGERKVPLVTGLTVLDARQNGAELPIAQEGGTHSALLTGPAEFAVTVETGLALTMEPSRASFTLPAPAAGTVKLTLSVPGEQTFVNLSPGLITSRVSSNGRTVIDATLSPGEPTQIWWAARSAPVVQQPPKEIRFTSDVKTLISVSDAELAVAALANVTVIQGDPAAFTIDVPEGYELTGATGQTLYSSEVQGHTVILRVNNPAARAHEFLISLAKANTDPKAEMSLMGFRGTQRETGEVLIESEGAVELTAKAAGLRRMDLRETSPYLRSLARSTLHAAFRYQKKPAETPAVALEWTRFPDSGVLAAVAQDAVVTTVITSEGRSLTEVRLTLKNHAQPFLKVGLPPGATIVSCEVGGEKVKPVEGPDGNRVPLMRPGFRPADSYSASFVFLHAGAPFQKKGGAELSLPKMDVPIGLLRWEVFLPQQFKVADFGGDALAAQLLPYSASEEVHTGSPVNIDSLTTGEVGGIIIDPTGAVVPGVEVTVTHQTSGITRKTYTDGSGQWLIADLPSGRLMVTAAMRGFMTTSRQFDHDAARGSKFNLKLNVGGVSQTVEVSSSATAVKESQQIERNTRQNAAQPEVASANVKDLERKVAGVLPIAINVPHTGASYRFVRPLVVDEETKLTFNYRNK